MPKRASLEPKRTTKPRTPWLINLPAAQSSTGMRERRYFETRKIAEEFSKQQRIRLENYGTASTLLPAGKIEEAQAAFDLMRPFGVGLLVAVEHYIGWRRKREKTVTFKKLFEEFEASKSKLSEEYCTALRTTLPRFVSLHERLAFEVESSEIEDATAGMTESVRSAFLRILRAAFNFGIKRGWCDKNPISRMEIGSLKPRRLILSNEEVVALLEQTIQKDFDLLPYQLFCTFAGVRPKEVERLTWKNVNMREKFIEIPDETSKTDIRRIVEMEPVLVRWLDYFGRSGGAVEEGTSIAPKKNLRARLRVVRKAAGIKHWPQDAPRRTYASCWLAAYNDVDKLNRYMGHTSPEMLFKHYNRAVTQKIASAFWKIGPPSSKAPHRRRKTTAIA